MVTKLVASVAIAGAAAVGLSAPAGADPSTFNVLDCGCPSTVPKGGPAVTDQINWGIEMALADLDGIGIPR